MVSLSYDNLPFVFARLLIFLRLILAVKSLRMMQEASPVDKREKRGQKSLLSGDFKQLGTLPLFVYFRPLLMC